MRAALLRLLAHKGRGSAPLDPMGPQEDGAAQGLTFLLDGALALLGGRGP